MSQLATAHSPSTHAPAPNGVLHSSPQPPQWSGSVRRFVSQPLSGSPSQAPLFGGHAVTLPEIGTTVSADGSPPIECFTVTDSAGTGPDSPSPTTVTSNQSDSPVARVLGRSSSTRTKLSGSPGSSSKRTAATTTASVPVSAA
jgi:hypothetical protein